MAKVYALVANGTEECELLIPVDILRRAGVRADILSVDGGAVVGSHGIAVVPDGLFSQANLSDCDMLLIPGGMPGTKRLGECDEVVNAVSVMLESGKRVAAICAAPALCLAAHGFLEGKRATCFPSFEDRMAGAVVTGERVVTDGLITTGRGLGCAVEFGLELVRLLSGDEDCEELKRRIVF